MKLKEAISLIQTEDIRHESPETWADLGSGSGLFTRALSFFLADQSLIYAIDKNLSSFKFSSSRDEVFIKHLLKNFETDSMDLSNLDGILMANSCIILKTKYLFLKMQKTGSGANPYF
jgi:hypothetical protein